MFQRLKRLLDKLETPANDWVLSRFGDPDAPVSSRDSRRPTEPPAVDELPESMPPSSKGSFDHWFDEQETVDASPPRSREIVSPNVSGEMVAVREPERKSRVS